MCTYYAITFRGPRLWMIAISAAFKRIGYLIEMLSVSLRILKAMKIHPFLKYALLHNSLDFFQH